MAHAIAIEEHTSFMEHQVEEGAGSWKRDLLYVYFQDLRRIQQLTADNNLRLFQAMDSAPVYERESISRKIFLGNLRLVVKFSFRHISRATAVGFTIMDCIQEGNFGLQRAIEKFDWRKGYTFGTYAQHWIRQAITRAVCDFGDQYGTCVPVHIHDACSLVRRTQEFMETQLGREVRLHEVYRQLREAAIAKGVKPLTLKQVGTALRVGKRSRASLETYWVAGEESARKPERLLHLVSQNTPDQRLTGENLLDAKEQLRPILIVLTRVEVFVNTLSARTAEILSQRLGLFGKPIRTLGEIGERYELTRERIRQIEERGFTEVEVATGFTKDELLRLSLIAEELQTAIASSY